MGAARAKADEARSAGPQGIAKADSLQAICEEYLARATIRSKEKRKAVLARLVYPTLGAKPIDEVRRSDIVRLLDEIEDKNGGPMADQTLSFIRRVMNWHASRSDDFRSPIVRGMARTKPAERARSRILTDGELRIVWNAAAADDDPFGPYLQFLLLTTARRGEAAAMTWAEIEGADWVLPAARNKTKVELVRPLSAAARAVLTRLPKRGGLRLQYRPICTWQALRTQAGHHRRHGLDPPRPSPHSPQLDEPG